jgi:hypothetical protein
MLTGETILGAVVVAVGALVWAVRIEGQVRTHEREIDQLRRDTETKIRQIHDAIDYIRQRIDRALEERAR